MALGTSRVDVSKNVGVAVNAGVNVGVGWGVCVLVAVIVGVEDTAAVQPVRMNVRTTDINERII